MKNVLIIIALLNFLRCTEGPALPDTQSLKQEVLAAENAFASMAATDGVQAAFAHFAADDAVLLRGKRLVKGKTALREYFSKQPFTEVKLNWKPDFVDVAASGEMAYTYGPYTFSAKDSSGQMISDTGYFHTVWKKQAGGQWRFVWD